MKKYMTNQGDADWFSDRQIQPDSLISHDHLTGSPMPSLKIAYDYIQDCKKIIDLGCGTGRTVEWFNNQGHEAIGITYNHKEVDYANNILNNKNIFYGDMLDLSEYEDNTFDAVTSFESIEHVFDMYTALNEMKRIVKPNGKIVIYIPGSFWIECWHHIIVPTIRQFKWLITRTGLIIDNIYVWKDGDDEATYFLRKDINS